jgi:hypothetical protein
MGLFDGTPQKATVEYSTPREATVEYSTPQPYQPRKEPLPAERQAAFAILREAGAGPSEAARVLGLASATGSGYEKKLNAYQINKDNLLKKSVSTLRKIAEGKPVGGDIMIDPETGQPRLDPDTGKPMLKGAVMPKGSDVMRAIENVLDREAPKVALSASISAEFMPIDLELYR